MPLCETMLRLGLAGVEDRAGDVADARVADLAAVAVDLGDGHGGPARAPQGGVGRLEDLGRAERGRLAEDPDGLARRLGGLRAVAQAVGDQDEGPARRPRRSPRRRRRPPRPAWGG